MATLNRPSSGKGEDVETVANGWARGRTRCSALIDELGLQTFETNVDGGNVYYRNGAIQTYSGTIPPAQGPAPWSSSQPEPSGS